MPEAPLPPGILLTGYPALPAWLDQATFALMRRAAQAAGPAGDAVALAREVAAARHPALPAALLTEAARLACSAGGHPRAGSAGGEDAP